MAIRMGRKWSEVDFMNVVTCIMNILEAKVVLVSM